jgi:hypothetical protein
MWNHTLAKAVMVACCAWSSLTWFSGQPVHPVDGELAPAEPRQVEAESSATMQLGRWSLTPRAGYEITARVLGHEHYRFDELADLIPDDLALGWGPMSDNRVLNSIDISQGNRFYYWQASTATPIAAEDITTHSANTHVIPGNAAIAKQLAKLRVGQVVTLSGELVDGARSDGRWIKTSLVRSDTGAGACEVLLVRDVMLK